MSTGTVRASVDTRPLTEPLGGKDPGRPDKAVTSVGRRVGADDERPPAPTVALGPAPAGVATPGRRLQPGGPWVAIGTAGAVTAVGIAWATGLFDQLGEILR